MPAIESYRPVSRTAANCRDAPALAIGTSPQLVLEPNQRLFRAGDLGSCFYVVRAGILRVEAVTEGGDRRILRLAGPGAAIGCEVLDHSPRRADVWACTRAYITAFPAQTHRDQSGQLPSAPYALLLDELQDAQDWALQLNHGPAYRRVARLLHRLTILCNGATIWLPSREEMGAIVGIRLETASREIARLRRRGVITQLDLSRAQVDTVRLQQVLQTACL